MKIGILSMQRVPNNGSFLQAYGLKRILENLGHDVVFIDYREGKPVVPYSERQRIRYHILEITFIKHLNDWLKYRVLGRKLFDYKYRLSYLKQLEIGYTKKYDTAVDVAIIGSDEVFNCLQSGLNVGFSPMLFGQGINAKRIISYAASFGYTDYEKLKKYGVAEKVGEYLKSFSAISVRDNNSKDIVMKLTGKTPQLNLDPVLISDFDVPEIEISYKDYVVLYTYKSREYSDADKSAIQEFCKQNNKKLVCIWGSQKWVNNKIETSPLELLAYIKGADFIITDTFHGTVFSVKYNKPFATLIRENNKQKIGDLLHRLKKEERRISSFEDLQSVYEQPIDYAITNSIIMNEKEHTLTYLRENLQ